MGHCIPLVLAGPTDAKDTYQLMATWEGKRLVVVCRNSLHEPLLVHLSLVKNLVEVVC